MLGFKKQVYSSPSSPPRWLLPGTISSKPTNTGEFVVVTQKNQLLPNKSWKRLQRWFRPRVCVASKQKYSFKHQSDSNPAVTAASSNAPDTGNGQVWTPPARAIWNSSDVSNSLSWSHFPPWTRTAGCCFMPSNSLP